MTENEIKEYIEELRHKANTLIKSGYATSGISTHFNKSSDLIEELLEYKLNGSFSGVELAQLAAMQMRLRDYQEIGTIEDFKALKEKSVAKKAKWHPNPCAEDNRIPICPNCNTIMVRTEIFGRTIDEHCVSCGQAIDWSE